MSPRHEDSDTHFGSMRHFGWTQLC